MLVAIEHIETYTAGLSFEQFDGNSMCSHAVRHNFGILGEAARAMPQWLKDRYPDVAWREAGDLRSFVVHVYWHVANVDIWDTVQYDVPVLKAQLLAIMKAEVNGHQS